VNQRILVPLLFTGPSHFQFHGYCTYPSRQDPAPFLENEKLYNVKHSQRITSQEQRTGTACTQNHEPEVRSMDWTHLSYVARRRDEAKVK
jgi:hypothetical protein